MSDSKKHPNDIEIMDFSPWLFTSIENLHIMSFGAPAQELSKKSVAELTGTTGAPLFSRIASGGLSALSGNKTVSAEAQCASKYMIDCKIKCGTSSK